MSARDDLYTELVKSVKKANQRLVRLEQADQLSHAYKIAVNDIQNMLGKESGKPRFSYRKSMTFNEIQKELKYVNRFNSSTSSTISGMKATVKKRSKTLSKKYGATQLNSLFKILSSESFKKLSELVPSAMVVQSVSDALNRQIDPDDIESALKKLIGQETDDYLIDTMSEMLENL